MTVILRPYQESAVDSVLEKLPVAQKGVVYCAPTGSGKTLVAAEVVQRMNLPSIFYVHRRELVDQTIKAYRAAGLPFSVISPDYDFYPTRHVIASIDTLLARLSSFRSVLAQARLLVADEAHHSVANKWRMIRRAAPDAMCLGPTATPWRTNGEGLGDCFSDVVMAPSVSALTDMGWLAPATIVKPDVRMPSFAGVKKHLGDYAVHELSKAVNLTDVNDAVVGYHRRAARDRPTVVFCIDVDHAKSVARSFRRAGYRAGIIVGDMKRKEREAAADGLVDGSLEVLVSVDVISEGYDVPRCACAVLLRPTLSTGLFLQQIGRVLRPDDEFHDALIIDAVGNSMQHGLPDEIRPWTLLDGAKNLERMVMKPKRCGCCFRVQRPSFNCVACGAPMILTVSEQAFATSRSLAA